MSTRIVGSAFLSIIVLLVIWMNLPITVTRYADVKLGNRIVDKIDKYNKTNGLPDPHDWDVLKLFGFKVDGDVWIPQYERIDSDTYELIFVEGFDGPYLLWNSDERNWKIDMPTTTTQD